MKTVGLVVPIYAEGDRNNAKQPMHAVFAFYLTVQEGWKLAV